MLWIYTVPVLEFDRPSAIPRVQPGSFSCFCHSVVNLCNHSGDFPFCKFNIQVKIKAYKYSYIQLSSQSSF